MNSVVVLQARMNSSRLPAKVILPINGIPLAVLAAKRAGNTGRKVIVATSSEETDDILVNYLEVHAVQYYRGSLTNTLDRVVNALANYDDNTLVFRLTADNVLPDGKLLNEIESDFLNRNLHYICCNGIESGVPYGLSVELTFLQHLREANIAATTNYDKEHVTPYIRRKFGVRYFIKYKELNKGHFRCTVDCLDDYIEIAKAFAGIQDPINVSCWSLIEQFVGSNQQPSVLEPVKQLALGTAQLGMNYGIANQSGKPKTEYAQKLIKQAIVNGVYYVDTARAYGSSEQIIREVLRSGWQGRFEVITKLSLLPECPQNAESALLNTLVDSSIYESCTNLGVEKLDVLLLHRTEHLHSYKGTVWARVKYHQKHGLINRIGVSVQTPAELEAALNEEHIEFIQMPFNILDYRWDHLIPKIRDIKRQRLLIVHVRSVLLQGVLAANTPEIWRKANLQNSAKISQWLETQVKKTNRKNIIDLCINYVRAMNWIDGVVIGMETIDQLSDNIILFSQNCLLSAQIEQIVATRPLLSENCLNPANWS